MKLKSVEVKYDEYDDSEDQDLVNELFLEKFHRNCEKYHNRVDHLLIENYDFGKFALDVEVKQLTIKSDLIPYNIMNLKMLQKLSLNDIFTFTQIHPRNGNNESLPEISNLPNLVELNLSNGFNFTYLLNISNLSKLKVLNIKWYVSWLPESKLCISNLMSLQSLKIDSKHGHGDISANNVVEKSSISVENINPGINSIKINRIYSVYSGIYVHYTDLSNLFTDSVIPNNLKEIDITTKNVDSKLLKAIKSGSHSIEDVECGLTRYRI
jgi:hypothetical protein